MLWVLSAVIGLLVGAAVVWIIQTTARRKDAALAEADLKVAQARVEMMEKSLEEQKEARKAEAEAMRREYDLLPRFSRRSPVICQLSTPSR